MYYTFYIYDIMAICWALFTGILPSHFILAYSLPCFEGLGGFVVVLLSGFFARAKIIFLTGSAGIIP